MKQTLVMATLTLCCAWLCSAPAPVYRVRPPRPLKLAGTWTLWWGSDPYVIHLRADSSCRTTDPERDEAWVGYWSVGGRTLLVNEARQMQDGNLGEWYAYEIDLDRDLRGTVRGRYASIACRLDRVVILAMPREENTDL